MDATSADGGVPPATPPEGELFLLRVWFEPNGDRFAWRASLLPPGGPRRYFATPDALLAALDGVVKARVRRAFDDGTLALPAGAPDVTDVR